MSSLLTFWFIENFPYINVNVRFELGLYRSISFIDRMKYYTLVCVSSLTILYIVKHLLFLLRSRSNFRYLHETASYLFDLVEYVEFFSKWFVLHVAPIVTHHVKTSETKFDPHLLLLLPRLQDTSVE